MTDNNERVDCYGHPLPPPPPPPPPPLLLPRRKTPVRHWLIAVGVLLTLVAAVFIKAMIDDRTRSSDAVRKTLDESMAKPVNLEGEAAERQRLEAFLKHVGEVSDSGGDAARCMDIEKMLQVAGAAEVLKGMSQRDLRDLMDGVRAGMRKSLPGAVASLWANASIQRVVLDRHASEAVAIVRGVDDEGTVSRSRLWLRKSTEGWRIYDFEDLRLGIRASALMATTFSDVGSMGAKGLKDLEAIQQAMNAMKMDDMEALGRHLGRIRIDLTSGPIRVVCRVMQARCHMGNSRWQEALDTLALDPGLMEPMPLTHLMRAQAMNWLGRHADALIEANRYNEAVGSDSNSSLEVGLAQAALGKPDEAVKAFRSVLADAPDCVEALVGLAKALPANRKGEISGHFRALSHPRDHFEAICEQLTAKEQTEALAAMVEAYRPLAGSDPDLVYYGAWVESMRGRPEQAAGMIAEVLPRLKDHPQRQYYIDCYVTYLLESGKPPLDIYLALGKSDRSRKMDDLVESRLNLDEDPQLLKVLEAYEADFDQDALSLYWKGILLTRAGDHKAATDLFARAASMTEEESLLERLRLSRVVAFHAQRKTLQAYRELPPRRATFLQLARLCHDDWDAATLAQLVEAHRIDPDDPALHLYDGIALFMAGDWARAEAVLTNRSDAILANEGNTWLHGATLTRAQMRQMKFDAALATAQSLTQQVDSCWMEAVVLIGAGRGDELLKIAETMIEEGYDLADLYDDPDVGEALKTLPVFASFRAKVPPPAAPAADRQPAGGGSDL